MKRDEEPIKRLRSPTENVAADIPENLLDADELLTRYGKWAVSTGRGSGAYTMERMYVPTEKHARYALDGRRESAYGQATKLPMMSGLDALVVQRALARVPETYRQVLAVLYIPRRLPPHRQLEIMRIPPRLSRDRHLSGLRMFANLHKQAVGRSA